MKRFECVVPGTRGRCNVVWVEQEDGTLHRESPAGGVCWGTEPIDTDTRKCIELHDLIKEIPDDQAAPR